MIKLRMLIKQASCFSLLDFLKLYFQTNVCNRCHNLVMMSINLSDLAIISIKVSESQKWVRKFERLAIF